MKKVKTEPPVVLTKKVGTTLIVTFNRPEARNAMSARLYSECVHILDKAYLNPDIRCIILTGAALLVSLSIFGIARGFEALIARGSFDLAWWILPNRKCRITFRRCGTG